MLALLRRAGLAAADEEPHAEPLKGGVSSDIWRVDLARGPVCIKQALERLRVEEHWEAPVERNRYEYEWFRTAAAAVPHAVPRVLAQADGVFVMEYLEPSRHPVWKEKLRHGEADPEFAARVGETLSAIHDATARRDDLAQLFATDDIFYAIRLEPYLVFSGERHRDLQGALGNLVRRTAATKHCLVHGDVSPKNILVGPRGPVFLDAECAWYGDPAFDLAFCLNHLLLKCLWVRDSQAKFLECFDALAHAYLAHAAWENALLLEGRTASLLPGLLLARVDGKSPVEYITTEKDKRAIRDFARRFLIRPPSTLGALRAAWQESLT